MNNYTLTIALICLTSFSGIRPADNDNRSARSGDADIKVSGTSNLHNWTMEAKNSSCSADFNFPPGNNSQPKSLTGLTLSIPVQNLKSGKSSMDSKAYAALKEKKYSAIVFVLTSATILPGQKNQFLVNGRGNLSIAGVTRPVTMEVTGIVNPDGTITCKGTEKLKMTDYQIKPPVYMLGALKTGDELTIDFTLTVAPSNHA